MLNIIGANAAGIFLFHFIFMLCFIELKIRTWNAALCQKYVNWWLHSFLEEINYLWIGIIRTHQTSSDKFALKQMHMFCYTLFFSFCLSSFPSFLSFFVRVCHDLVDCKLSTKLKKKGILGFRFILTLIRTNASTALHCLCFYPRLAF